MFFEGFEPIKKDENDEEILNVSPLLAIKYSEEYIDFLDNYKGWEDNDEYKTLTVKDIIRREQQDFLCRIWHDPDDEAEAAIYEAQYRSEEMQEIKLEEDIYCIGFLVFLNSDCSQTQGKVVLKAIFTLTFQFMIVGLMVYEYLDVGTSAAVKSMLGRYLNGVEVGTPSVNMARIITCFLLHLELLPELDSAKHMLSFARRNPTSFSGQSF